MYHTHFLITYACDFRQVMIHKRKALHVDIHGICLHTSENVQILLLSNMTDYIL